MAGSAPRPDALERVLSTLVPGARVVACAPLDGTGASAVARKEGGYSRAWRVSVAGDGGEVRDFVFRTAGSDEFGHDRRADRAANLLLAFDTFGAIPEHVHALDVGFETPDGLRSLRGAGEPYLITTFVEGRLYAEDLRRVAAAGEPSALDLDRCDALAGWLAALHADRIADPAAWRRAVRDLLGHGEGIFGIVDAYGPGVAAAPPERLARIEQRCLEWRWALRGHPERLRRTHGDFHPFNIVFPERGVRFTALDASRGCKGDPADDVTALAINYVFFALQSRDAWRRGFGPLWRRFWQRYLDAAGEAVLASAAPFLAWRALVLGCPRFYPALSPSARDALLGLAERALGTARLDPRIAEDLFP